MPDEQNAKSGSEAQEDSSKKDRQRRIAIAFQGGSFFGGAIAAGTVCGLVEGGAFNTYDISVFSGISSGALVATVCWGHALQNRIQGAPQVLQEQWLHNALNIIPTEQAGNAALMMDELLSANPIYSLGFPRNLGYPGWKETFLIPCLHGELQRWVDLYLKPDICMQYLRVNYAKALEGQLLPGHANPLESYKNNNTLPRLIVGAANILHGENAEFTDTDFFSFLCEELNQSGNAALAEKKAAEMMVECVMASGSLDELNGITQIKPRSYVKPRSYAKRDISGYYLDGGWSENPPISALTDYSVDEIWIVEVFPKERAKLPETFEQRVDRREELLQNSGVEQQLVFINKLNDWIACGQLNNKPKAYRHITVRRISLPPQMQQLTHGARIVNARSFITDMLEFGRQNALAFYRALVP